MALRVFGGCGVGGEVSQRMIVVLCLSKVFVYIREYGFD